MAILIDSEKPRINHSKIFCTFRTSKAYLWGIVHDQLLQLSDSHVKLDLLDAACHALITRDMVPDTYNYYGLDISQLRLRQAFKIKKNYDTLYLADILKEIPLDSSFDVVNTLNTLSHLDNTSHFRALRNLVKLCKKGGHFFVNINLKSNFAEIADFLNKNFEEVRPIYYGSLRSYDEETKGIVNRSNILEKLVDNEYDIPNDASFHKQVLFIAKGCLYGDMHGIQLNPSPRKIIQLNKISHVGVLEADDDYELLAKIKKAEVQPKIVLTNKLSKLSENSSFKQLLKSNNIDWMCLDDILSANYTEVFSKSEKIFILGLEAEWSNNHASDRIIINRLKSDLNVAINLTFVRRRNGLNNTYSTVLSDA